MKRAAFALLFVTGCLSGCLVDEQPAGDEILGTYEFSVQPLADNCSLTPVPGTPESGIEFLPFTAVVSRDSETGDAFVSISGVEHPATFDGQRVTMSASAPRRFPECECGDSVELHETLTVALLSRSQDQALNPRQCPLNPLDGGIPKSTTDGGIRAPGTTEAGFDAVRACGELVDELVPDPLAGCRAECACTMVYRLEAVRR